MLQEALVETDIVQVSAAGLPDLQLAVDVGSLRSKAGSATKQDGNPDLLSLLSSMLSPQLRPQEGQGATASGLPTQSAGVVKGVKEKPFVPAQRSVDESKQKAPQAQTFADQKSSLSKDSKTGKEKGPLPEKANEKSGFFQAALPGGGTSIPVQVVVPPQVTQASVSLRQKDIRVSHDQAEVPGVSLAQASQNAEIQPPAGNQAIQELKNIASAAAENSNPEAANVMRAEMESSAALTLKTNHSDDVTAKPVARQAEIGPVNRLKSADATAPPSGTAPTQANHRPVLPVPETKGNKSSRRVMDILPAATSKSLNPALVQAGADGARMLATQGNSGGHSAGAKANLELPQANPFQRMDASAPQATLLKSKPQQVAVGVRDPSLGWIEIQTQSTAGHISALLSTSSTEAHAALTAEAPALTQFMAEQNIQVYTVTVDMQGGGVYSGQSQGGADHPPQQPLVQPSISAATHPVQPSVSEEESIYPGHSSHISVRA